MKKVVIAIVFSILIAIPVVADETEAETERSYTETDLWFLSRIIQCEAGYCSREMMEGVGSVVLNRRDDPRFPDTIEEVICQPGQYSTLDWLESNPPTEEALEVAKDLLEHGSVYPKDVIYQANFVQGAIYKSISTSYSVMYFCVG